MDWIEGLLKRRSVMIATVASAVAIVAGLGGAYEVVEPITPVTHGYLRQYMQRVQIERERLINEVRNETVTKLDETQESVQMLQVDILNNTIRSLGRELVDIRIRLRENPNDSMFLQREQALQDDIQEAQASKAEVLRKMNQQ